jgi:hypothetical protein
VRESSEATSGDNWGAGGCETSARSPMRIFAEEPSVPAALNDNVLTARRAQTRIDLDVGITQRHPRLRWVRILCVIQERD